MRTESVRRVVGADADVGNRLPLFVVISNRLTPSSWLTEKVSVLVSVNVNSKIVAFAKPPVLRTLDAHAPIQSPAGSVVPAVAKKPGMLLVPPAGRLKLIGPPPKEVSVRVSGATAAVGRACWLTELAF